MPLVAVKLLVETPVTASLKAAVKLINPLVTAAATLSVTAVTVGARVSIPWLSSPDRLAATAALPPPFPAPPPRRIARRIARAAGHQAQRHVAGGDPPRRVHHHGVVGGINRRDAGHR